MKGTLVQRTRPPQPMALIWWQAVFRYGFLVRVFPDVCEVSFEYFHATHGFREGVGEYRAMMLSADHAAECPAVPVCTARGDVVGVHPMPC